LPLPPLPLPPPLPPCSVPPLLAALPPEAMFPVPASALGCGESLVELPHAAATLETAIIASSIEGDRRSIVRAKHVPCLTATVSGELKWLTIRRIVRMECQIECANPGPLAIAEAGRCSRCPCLGVSASAAAEPTFVGGSVS
jgi:hypothetical protein